MQFKAEVKVSLKKGVLDPQGFTVEGAVGTMGYKGVSKVRIGKLVELFVEAESKEQAEVVVAELGKKILTNPVMETFTFQLEEVK
jgi:phosphoribosylformylglycinamidine synthase PurS subunit